MRDLSDNADTFEYDYAGERAPVLESGRAGSGFFGISSGLFVLLMFCAVVVSFGLVLFKIVVAEREAAQREVRSVERAFENHKSLLLKEMERYAASNAAYVNVETHRSLDWITERFGVDMALDFAHDYTALVDGRGNVIFAARHAGVQTSDFYLESVNERISGTIGSIRDNYTRALVRTADGNIRFAGSLPDISSVDVIAIEGRPHIVAAFAIVPDPGGIDMLEQPPSILITTFAIDAAHLNQLLANLSLDNLSFNSGIPDGMIGVPLAGSSGNVLGHLTWYPVSQASAIILSSIPVLAVALGVILAITMVALRQNARAKRRLAQREREARYAASHDSMTGCASRGYFQSAATKRLNLCAEQGKTAWVVYVDIDNLKQVNDIHGHSVGDSLIVTQVRRMQQFLGPNDLLGRIGGDEFLILTERWRTETEATAEIARMFAELRRPSDCEGKQLVSSISAGLARFPDHGNTLVGLVRSADIALQRCKKEEKNAFRLFDARMDDRLREQREIRVELDAALRNGEFELFYQPIVTADSDRTAYCEALIRWRHPVRGLVSPAVFIPVAQDAGLMPDIGNWVLERALRDASGWPSTGVSVNVCTSQIQTPKFAEKVAALLRKYRFPPERLVLEITEDLMLEENPLTQETFRKLGELNVGLAIDDFGTGFCSLSYLHKYRFDKMKIDRSFVSRIGLDEEADLLVRSLLGLAKVMGMKAVGEGVETEAQKAFLVKEGCDYLQGFLFSKPRPVDELPQQIRQQGAKRAGTA
ncbi:MAG: EAL domain-containing protein [Roseibium sp.]